jgi:hypothetical protein
LENIAVNNDRAASEQGNAWTRFWFTPARATGLKCLRVLSGLVFCFWLLSFLGHQQEFFSLNGWFDADAYKEVLRQQNLAPAPIGWSILYLAGENAPAFQALYWSSLAVLLLFTLGVATRLTSVLTWIIVVSFLANPATSYEGDYLLGILAFYLMLGHLLVGQWSGNLSLAERIFGARDDFVFARWLFPTSAVERPASHGAQLMMRLLQIHFAIVILTSALHKLQIADWWAGVALWYPLHPTFSTTLESLRREAPNAGFTLFYLSLAQYVVLAWQLAFPLFAWRAGWWRILLLGGAAIGWLGTFFLFKLPLFGPFVMLGCLSFLRPEEWAWGLDCLRSLWSSAALAKSGSEPKKVALAASKDAKIKK